MWRWLEEGDSDLDGDDDVPADPVADFGTQKNQLSVWHVEDDQSNLEDVLTAIAAKAEFISHSDYSLIRREFLDEQGIAYRQSSGESPFEQANEWHYDIVNLSGLKILGMVRHIMERGSKDRIGENRMETLLRGAVAAGRIPPAKLHLTMRKRLDA